MAETVSDSVSCYPRDLEEQEFRLLQQAGNESRVEGVNKGISILSELGIKNRNILLELQELGFVKVWVYPYAKAVEGVDAKWIPTEMGDRYLGERR